MVVEKMTEAEKKNIILIGFMGSGKTVVGRAISRLIDYEFVDTDNEIEKVTGLAIAQIFKKYGKLRFHSEEELAYKKLLNREGLVIATGGNINPQGNPLKLLQNKGFFVLLEAKPEILYRRLKRKNTRPMFNKNTTQEELKELVAQQYDYYKNLADFKIDTSKISVETAATAIVKAFRNK
jgi:shikimate kinase